VSATVHTQFVTLGDAANPIHLREGGMLPGVTVAYQTWGTLNGDHSNAILVLHALSGSQHVAGHNPSLPEVGGFWQPELQPGRVDTMIRPRKAIATRKDFLLLPYTALFRSRNCALGC